MERESCTMCQDFLTPYINCRELKVRMLFLHETLVVKFYSPSRDKVHLRIAERHIPEYDLTLLFMLDNRKGK